MITTYNLVSEALKPVEEFVKTAESDDSYDNHSGKRTVAIRLDFEYPADWPENAMVRSMMVQLRDDIMDLITNGDVNHASDPLLKCFDGEVKRGKRLEYVEFPSGHFFRELKARKNSYEYTLHLIIYVEFS